MNKRDHERHYESLSEKNYIMALQNDIAERYDFTSSSWLCQTIVTLFCKALDDWEEANKICRIKPGEVLLPLKKNLIGVPLVNYSALKILIETKLFLPYKKRIIENIRNYLIKSDQEATLDDVYSLVSLRDTIPRYEKATDFNDLEIDPSFPLINPQAVGITPPQIKTASIAIDEKIKRNIIDKCVHQFGLKPFIAHSIFDYFIERRNTFLPLHSDLKPGQFIWIGTSFKKCKKVGSVYLKRQQVPIILTLYSQKELREKPKTLSELNDRMITQLVRVTTEAYLQGTLLSHDELQLFYLRSATVIGKLLRKYMKLHKVIVPTPGTILDAGTMFTHKEVIIDLCMQGYFTQEIAKKTYHDPRSVDAYLRVFNAIMILWHFDVPPELMAMICERGLKVVKEHLVIVEKYFPDKQSIKTYLNRKGIAI